MAEPQTSTITSPPGGVMTDEVGAVTGDLTVTTQPMEGERVGVTVAYVGAEDTYHVTGQPVAAAGMTHKAICQRLTTDPGADQDGNAGAVDLR